MLRREGIRGGVNPRARRLSLGIKRTALLVNSLPIVLLALAACTSNATTSPTIAPGSPSGAAPTASAQAVAAATGDYRVALSPPPNLIPATVTRVVDGDTIVVSINGQEQKLRYIGVNTPETVDPYKAIECFGHEASDRNHQLVDGQTVGLERDVSETDVFGRLLRYVWLGDRMINAELVEEGYAQAATYPPDIRYQHVFVQLQAQARAAGLGLWGPACTSLTPTAAAAAGGCDYSSTSQPLIKGNISSSGEKIYHVPGGAFYDATTIDESADERWFCTEAEAQAAGWRRSSR